jgi:hypothetical protein
MSFEPFEELPSNYEHHREQSRSLEDFSACIPVDESSPEIFTAAAPVMRFWKRSVAEARRM